MGAGNTHSNLIIIGMPGCGKSTLGRRFAADLGLAFMDTDSVLEEKYQCSVQEIVDRRGISGLRRLEEHALCELEPNSTVISTGGSAVYSERAMKHLRSIGTIVYLEISLPTLLRRVNNSMQRGLAMYPSESLHDLYHRRLALYRQWADVTLRNDWPLSAIHYDRLFNRVRF